MDLMSEMSCSAAMCSSLRAPYPLCKHATGVGMVTEQIIKTRLFLSPSTASVLAAASSSF